ncbi:MAG: matrixin family metalloprotease [Acidobacteriia bacterium]|nr:matrixin family metalloprotease [Terriglobia bacterium]
MRRAARFLTITAALGALAPMASAYYYFVYFATRNTPFVQVPVRFDVANLQNRTVTYLIANQGPGQLVQGDSFNAIISQIRAAADVWSNVSSSGIRLAFGGLSSFSTPSSSPEIDVVFDDDMPPGLIAQTKPFIAANAGSLVAGGASFVPILRSKVQLRSDLTNPAVPTFPVASYQDSFFLTVVHEFGHALGLQHTETASAMSTQITRGTTKAAPLTADDVAGISALYPANGFLAATGSITGTVSLNGAGVNMAVVTVLSTSGVAVSAVTSPDGSYRIDAVPPGQYYVYVHPLPPAQQGEGYPDNIVPPQDTAGNPFNANTGFGGQFLGGTTDWTQAPQVSVVAGSSSDGMNFNVQRRTAPAVYDLVLYGFLGASQAAVQAPPLQSNTRSELAFYASSTLNSSGYLQPAPELTVSAIGGAAQVEQGSVQGYPGYAPYMLMTVDTDASISTATPVALAISVNNDLYVLPNSLSVVPSGLPTITNVSGTTDAQGNSTVNITGANLGSSTRILFDGAQATSQTINADGSLTVVAPPASAGYRAAVEALTSDGQTSSLALGSAAPPAFTYGGPAFPSISVNPSTVTAGTDTMIDIIGNNTNFVSGQTVVGFGSSDILVKKVWVVSPGWLRMNISINAAAPPTATTVSVASGLQLASLSTAFQIAPAVAGQITMRTPILNHATHQAGIPQGGVAEINVDGLTASLAGWTLLIGNQPVAITAGDPGQILAALPFGMVPGPVVVQLNSPNGAVVPPVLLQVDAPAPNILSAVTGFGTPIDASHPVQAGSTITVLAGGILDPFGNLPAASTAAVNFGAGDQTVLSVGVTGGTTAIQVAVPQNLPSGAAQITLRVDTRISTPYTIYIQ